MRGTPRATPQGAGVASQGIRVTAVGPWVRRELATVHCRRSVDERLPLSATRRDSSVGTRLPAFPASGSGRGLRITYLRIKGRESRILPGALLGGRTWRCSPAVASPSLPTPRSSTESPSSALWREVAVQPVVACRTRALGGGRLAEGRLRRGVAQVDSPAQTVREGVFAPINGPRRAERVPEAAATSRFTPSACAMVTTAGSSPSLWSFLCSSGVEFRGLTAVTWRTSSLHAAGLARQTNTSDTQMACARVQRFFPGRRTRTGRFPGRDLSFRLRKTSARMPTAHSHSGTPSNASTAQITTRSVRRDRFVGIILHG